MDTVETQAIIDESTIGLADLADPIEGLEDDLRANILDTTRPIIEAKLIKINQRKGKVSTVLRLAKSLADAIDELLKDGYPDLPVDQVEGSVTQDLDNQLRTQAAARKLFVSSELTTIVTEKATKRPTPAV